MNVATPTGGVEPPLFAPDILLPTQMARLATDRWLRRLYGAILEDALECLEGRGAPSSTGVHTERERARRRQQAWDWILSDTKYCFAFHTVCLVLDLDVDAVRRQLTRRFALEGAPRTGVSHQLQRQTMASHAHSEPQAGGGPMHGAGEAT
jgi:hypothetical protein